VNKDVLLINPVVREWAEPNCFPLGLGYIASVLYNSGCDISIADFNIERHLDVRSYLEELSFSHDFMLIGITGIITQYKEIKRIAKICRYVFPGAKIVCGGTIASSIPYHLLRNTDIDIVVVGEGENTIVEVADFISENNSNAMFNIDGVIYTDRFKNEYCGENRRSIKDISTIFHPKYGLFLTDKYVENPIAWQNWRKWDDGKKIISSFKYTEWPSMNLIATRGCPYNCLRGDAIIDTTEGFKKIKDLVGKIPKVLTRDSKTKKVVYAQAKAVFKTRENAEMVRVHFTDGSHIDCTPDHRFMALQYANQYQPRKEWEVEARNLIPGQSVVACRYSGQLKEARTMMERIIGRKLKKDECVHHIDGDHINNSFDNLILCSDAKEHIAQHPGHSEKWIGDKNPIHKLSKEELSDRTRKTFLGRKCTEEHRRKLSITKLGNKNPMFGKDGPNKGETRTDEVKIKISNKLKGRVIDHEWRKKISESHKGRKFTDEHKKHMRDAWKIRKQKKVQAKNHKVAYVEKLSFREDVYCMEVPGYDWFFANDILVHNCIYCYHNYMGEGYRVRTVEDILSEMQELVEDYSIKYFHFVDDTFVFNVDWVKEFCRKKILNSDLRKVYWSCAGRANVVNEELVKEMVKSNCIGICYGLESGSERMLRVMNKKVTLDMYRKAIRLNHEYFGYHDYSFIVGTPGETEKTVQESIHFCSKMKIKPSVVFYMTPYPGTSLFNNLCKSEKSFCSMVNNNNSFDEWLMNLDEQGRRITWNCSGSSDEKLIEWKQRLENC